MNTGSYINGKWFHPSSNQISRNINPADTSDVIAEFPPPGPSERRALWLAHLGDGQGLDTAAVNRLAAGCELAGGHVRNVVLAAAARARGRRIVEADLLPALAAEYAKLGKPVPAGLRGAEGLPAETA